MLHDGAASPKLEHAHHISSFIRLRSARRSRRFMLPNEALLIWNEINRKCLCVFVPLYISLLWWDCNEFVYVEISWWRIDSLTFSDCRLYIMNEWNWVCRKWASTVWMPHLSESGREQADGLSVGIIMYWKTGFIKHREIATVLNANVYEFNWAVQKVIWCNVQSHQKSFNCISVCPQNLYRRTLWFPKYHKAMRAAHKP